MWTEVGWRVVSARTAGASRGRKVLLLVMGLGLLPACGESGAPEAETGSAPVESETPAGVSEQMAAAPATVADLFPEAPAKQLVLSNCTSCHAVACAAIGQRSESRWNELASAHREHVPSLSDDEREQIFAYLAEHFNDRMPEPNVPPEFIQQGCTPF